MTCSQERIWSKSREGCSGHHDVPHPYLSRPPGSCGTARVFESWILHPGDLVSSTGPPDLRAGVEVCAQRWLLAHVLAAPSGGERGRREGLEKLFLS